MRYGAQARLALMTVGALVAAVLGVHSSNHEVTIPGTVGSFFDQHEYAPPEEITVSPSTVDPSTVAFSRSDLLELLRSSHGQGLPPTTVDLVKVKSSVVIAGKSLDSDAAWMDVTEGVTMYPHDGGGPYKATEFFFYTAETGTFLYGTAVRETN